MLKVWGKGLFCSDGINAGVCGWGMLELGVEDVGDGDASIDWTVGGPRFKG